MASKKPQIPIEVPSTGVRKDKNPLIHQPNEAADGINVMYFDGTVRPRPALTNELFGTTDAPAWERVYDDGQSSGYHLTAMTQWTDGTLVGSAVNAAYTAQKFVYSADGGLTWQDCGFAHPQAGVGGDTDAVIVWMQEIAGFLWCYAKIHVFPDPPTTHTPGEYLYRGLVTDIKDTVVFTSLGPMEVDGSDGSNFWVTGFIPEKTTVDYDSDADALVFSAWYGNYGDPGIWALHNATTTVTANDQQVINPAAFLAGTVAGRENSQTRWVHNEWIVWGTMINALSFPTPIAQGFIYAKSLVFNSDTSEYDYDDYDEYIRVFRTDTENRTSFENATGVTIWAPTELDQANGILIPCSVLIDDLGDYNIDMLVWKLNTPGATPEQLNFEVKQTITNGDLNDLDTAPESIGGRQVMIWMGQSAGPFKPDEDYLRRGITSDTNGGTWKVTSGSNAPDGDLFYQNERLIWNDTTRNHYVAFRTTYVVDSVADRVIEEVWLSPTSGGPSKFGDVTSLEQMDMDDEDAVVVVGTTRNIMRLDRDNLQWVSLAADHTETVDTGAAGTWIETGDIPPLGVTEDRTEYVSGTSINGVYGSNPWVFRSFEVQDNTFLLGTNGQCRPICYHPDMAGGFARRMGEVPPSDPNDLPAWDADNEPYGYLRTGNLAPIAKCMATGMNRVVLANLPAYSPFAIEVSGFNDPDRGWGLEQYSLLGDTPGEIVSLNEISALNIAIYKTDAIYHAIAQTEFLGVAAPFRFELSKAGISGPCSAASILRNFDGRQIFLARDGGVYMYDGVAPIDGGRNIRRMIQGKIDLNNLGKCWGMVDNARKLVWFFYPSKDGLVNKGLVLSTDQGYPWPCWEAQLPAGWNFAAGGTVVFDDDINIGDVGRLGDYGEENLSSFSSGNQQMLMGTQTNVWFSQKWEDDGDYSDDGAEIDVLMRGGWTQPGQVEIWTADELYHIFSSPDPAMELRVRLIAQQIGQRERASAYRALSAGKLRRRTHHRISGQKFAPELSGRIHRMFNWGGAVMTAAKRGGRG